VIRKNQDNNESKIGTFGKRSCSQWDVQQPGEALLTAVITRHINKTSPFFGTFFSFQFSTLKRHITTCLIYMTSLEKKTNKQKSDLSTKKKTNSLKISQPATCFFFCKFKGHFWSFCGSLSTSSLLLRGGVRFGAAGGLRCPWGVRTMGRPPSTPAWCTRMMTIIGVAWTFHSFTTVCKKAICKEVNLHVRKKML
jgi:hypothetical protein